MPVEASDTVSLTTQWFIRPGFEAQVIEAVTQLAADVASHEPGTLTYLVHTLRHDDAGLQTFPPTHLSSLVFFEVYRDADAFEQHVNGPWFTRFVQQYGDLFISSDGKPYHTVQFLTQRAGFALGRPRGAAPSAAAVDSPPPNRHPVVMFEIIAKDQAAAKTFYSQVFGWNYQVSPEGFAYVHFPVKAQPLLGGIGQANSSIPGFDPGHNFYLLVDDLAAAIERAVAAGGTQYVAPTRVDGYNFAMIRDPEGNPVGLIEPFSE